MSEYQELETIARSLAVELSTADFPNIWRVAPNRREWWRDIHTRDAWITLRIENNRLHIASARPREMRHGATSEAITVDKNRTPEAIARDIVRRLLPDARAYFEKCRESTRKEKEAQTQHAELLHQLSPFKKWKTTDSGGTRTDWRSNRTRADVYTERIYELKISSPTLEETIQILRILGE